MSEERLWIDDQELVLENLEWLSSNKISFTYKGQSYTFAVHQNQGAPVLSRECNGNEHHAFHVQALKDQSKKIQLDGFTSIIKDHFDELEEQNQEDENRLLSPLPGTVIEVSVQEGDVVEEGASLMILEAMKMEHSLHSPKAAKVVAVHAKCDDRVEEGKCLIELEWME